MGKRSKKKQITEDTIEILAKGDEMSKRKKRSSAQLSESTDNIESDSLHNTVDEKVVNNLDTHLKDKTHKRSKKNKTSKTSEELSQEEVKNNVSMAVGSTNHSKKKKRKEVQTADNNKPMKIVFVDDQPQEVSPDTTMNNQGEKKKNKQSLNEEDAAVKDEEIDQFCDELGEHDNEQYENWVKLIEAKLHSHNT